VPNTRERDHVTSTAFAAPCLSPHRRPHRRYAANGDEAEGPAGALDFEIESQQIHDQCAQALAHCNRQNCDLHNSYSGCAVDCVGCFGPTIGQAFSPERWEMHPSFGTCVLPIIEGYVAEGESIQASFLSRTINVYQQSESERAVRDIVSEALVRCEHTACETRCSDLGVGGGMQG
jgi:hypothetical protein